MSVCVYLWFIANKDVVVHGLWDVVDDELQVGSFWYVDETHAGPRRTAIQGIRPLHHRHTLMQETDRRRLHIQEQGTERIRRTEGTLRRAHGSVLGVLGLIGVVIQRDEVEARLDLIAASPKHVLPAHTLTRMRVTAVERETEIDFSGYYLSGSIYICHVFTFCCREVQGGIAHIYPQQ